jgi:hypothetical protein
MRNRTGKLQKVRTADAITNGKRGHMQSRREFVERATAGAAFMLRHIQTQVAGGTWESLASNSHSEARLASSMMVPRNRYYKGPPSDHFDGSRFFNPGQPSNDRGLLDILRWRLAGGAARWPKSVPVTPVKPEERITGLRVTMVGHASMLIQVAGVTILTDPVWSQRASPFAFAGPKRVTAPGIAFDDLPPIDAVLISHCHYDPPGYCDVTAAPCRSLAVYADATR